MSLINLLVLIIPMLAADNLCSRGISNGLLPNACSPNGANKFENPNNSGDDNVPAEDGEGVPETPTPNWRKRANQYIWLRWFAEHPHSLGWRLPEKSALRVSESFGLIPLLPKTALVLCRRNWCTWFCEWVYWMYDIFLASFARLFLSSARAIP